MRYVRSPASFFADSIWTLCFLLAVEMKPRTLCACQSVAFMMSARVAPLARAIISRIFAPLLSARGAATFLAALGLAVFSPAFATALVAFFRRSGLGFGSLVGILGPFLGLGRALLLAGGFLRGGFLPRDVRALCRNGGGFFGGVGFWGRHLCGYPFLCLLRA